MEQKIQNIINSIKPYILRRESSVVEKSLPTKTEYILHVGMAKMQEQYMKYVIDLNQTALKYASNDTVKLANIMVQLKKVCNHPYMFRE